jgi:GNAT superfamily N-acetyltransferase
VTSPHADLVARIQRVASAFIIAWVEGIRDLPGNPEGVTVAHFGGATALACTARPTLDFVNSAHGLDPAEPARVDEVTAFYRAAGTRGHVEVAPARGIEDVTARLAAAGWSHTGFHCSLHGRAVPPKAPGAVEVVEAGPADVPDFSRILAEGHGVPAAERAAAQAGTATWYGRDGWRLYLALLEGEPAAAAALTVTGGLGYLANAATLPSARRHGCQAALLARRIADAADAGCDTVASLAAFGSASHRNLERAGLRVAFTQAVWEAGAIPPRA